LTLPLRSRAHLRDYGSHEHPNATTPISTTWITPYLPAARPGVGGPRTTDLRAVPNAIFYLLRTGCQWRLLPREFPRPGTVYHYFVPGKMRARPMKIEWARQLRDQCKAASIPFFMKQTSGRIPGKVPIPPDLMIREFPKYTSRIRARACAIPRRFTNSGGS
jgi:transposase